MILKRQGWQTPQHVYPLRPLLLVFAMLLQFVLFLFLGVTMLTLLCSPAPSVQLPAVMPSGLWSCCFLQLSGSGWAELAGVPVAFSGSAVAKLQAMGASRVSVASSGTQLCVIRFQAQRSVLLDLSIAFPSACRVA